MRTPTIALADIPENVRIIIEDIIRCLTKISFGDNQGNQDRNIDCVYVSGTTDGVANTETTHAHNLNRTPVGYIIISKDKAGDIYDSAAHTSTVIKLKCSVASVTFKAIVF